MQIIDISAVEDLYIKGAQQLEVNKADTENEDEVMGEEL